MWGSQSWGEMIWGGGGGGAPVPMLSPPAIALLILVLIGTVLLGRRAHAPGWLAWLGGAIVVSAPFASYVTSLVTRVASH